MEQRARRRDRYGARSWPRARRRAGHACATLRRTTWRRSTTPDRSAATRRHRNARSSPVDSPEQDWASARRPDLSRLPPGRDARSRDRDDRPRLARPRTGRSATPSRSSTSDRAELPVVYTIDAGAYDIVVNGDHLLAWGVEPSDIQDAAMGNLAALVGTARVDRRDLGRAPADQLRHRQRLGRGADPAARGASRISRRSSGRSAGSSSACPSGTC